MELHVYASVSFTRLVRSYCDEKLFDYADLSSFANKDTPLNLQSAWTYISLLPFLLVSLGWFMASL
jgi:hypothetical protein